MLRFLRDYGEDIFDVLAIIFLIALICAAAFGCASAPAPAPTPAPSPREPEPSRIAQVPSLYSPYNERLAVIFSNDIRMDETQFLFCKYLADEVALLCRKTPFDEGHEL